MKFKILFSFFLLLSSFGYSAESGTERSENVAGQLVTDVTTIQPGQSFTLALRLKMDKGWHTYWRNGADSGLPTSIEWTLPEGFSADEMQWPLPERIDTPPLVSYGYHGEIFLLNKINVPGTIKDGQTVTIQARADWLECEDVCIPGGVDLSIDLKVSNAVKPDENWVTKLADARALIPVKESGWQFSASENDSVIILQAKAPEWFNSEPGEVSFFSYEFGVIEYAEPQISNYKDGILTLKLNRPADAEPMAVEGVLVSEHGWRGQGSERAQYVNITPGSLFSEPASTSKSGIDSILIAILFSFLGGIILNLMPCVLPVLSIKIMGFVQQANSESNKAWQHGAVFTLGVLVSFWTLAGILLGLRAGGEEIGWGFQLQEPIFLIILSVFLFLFGLSMFGVFEIGTSLTTIEGKTGKKEGWMGSFVSGVTATVVATPCTAPFMGSALGFALTQPAWASMSIFTFLGLGMAFPYILLTSIPSLLRFVPKPGRWMESMKQFMGFLLVGTVIWLLWVLGIQAGANVVIMVLGALLIISIAGWIYGRWGNLAMSKRSRMISITVALLLLASSLYATISNVETFSATTDNDRALANLEEGIPWQSYSEELIRESIETKKPLFIDFTAAWCLSCQVNERVTFSSKDVQDKFNELGITAVKADWTKRDEEITRALAGYGRNSVPLYVYYPAGERSEPILLPELITPGIVLDTFEKHAN